MLKAEKVETLQQEINNLNLLSQEEANRHKQDLEMKIRWETLKKCGGEGRVVKIDFGRKKFQREKKFQRD